MLDGVGEVHVGRAVGLLGEPVAHARLEPQAEIAKMTALVARSMDWVEDMHTNLWVFPRGMKRDGGLGKGSIEWTSKYGSVVASIYEGGTADGMNEKGLVVNELALVERHIAEGLSPVDATHKAMDEVSGAVIAIALVLVTLLPYAIRMSGALYLCAALALGGMFLVYAVQLYRDYSDLLARATLKYSIVYLAALFSALLIDHYWR